MRNLRSKGLSRLLLDFLVEQQVQQRPRHDVDDEHQRVVEPVYRQEVEGAEAGGHQQDGDHGRAGREAHGQELVVDVVLVRQEGVPAVAHAVQDDAYHVQRRDQQHAEGHQHGRAAGLGQRVARVHAVAHGEQAEQVAQHQAARVAHEDFPAAGGVAEDVVGEEGDEHADADESHQGVDPPVVPDEQAAEHGQRHHAQPGGQPIDAVDEVDGVGDEHHQHQREGHADEGREHVDAEEPVEVVDVEPGEGEHQRGEQLHDELLGVAHADEVVRHAHDVEQGESGSEQQQLGGHGRRQQLVQRPSEQQAQPDEAAHAEEDDGEEAEPAQTRHEGVVHLPLVGHVEEPFAEGDQQYVGDDDLAEDDGGDQGGHDQPEVL